MIDDAHTTDTDLGCRTHVSEVRDHLAIVLHRLYCDGRHDNTDGPCWTAWADDADRLMVPVRVALQLAWQDGAHNGRGFEARNPYAINASRPSRCDTCHGAYGWTGNHGVWEPCPKCGVA